MSDTPEVGDRVFFPDIDSSAYVARVVSVDTRTVPPLLRVKVDYGDVVTYTTVTEDDVTLDWRDK